MVQFQLAFEVESESGRHYFSKVFMNTKSEFTILLAALIAAQTVPLNVMAINAGSNTTKSSLSAPVYAKLGGDTSKSRESAQPVPDLSPVKLDKSDDSVTAAEAANSAPVIDSSDAGALNGNLEQKEFIPKAPVERTDNVMGEESVVSVKDKKKQARNEAYEKSLREAANRFGPAELQPTDKEVRDKVMTILDAEKTELAEIWDAALCRSQDIQFVVQKLTPTKDPKHSTAVMMKMLSTAMYGTVAATSMMGGSVGGSGGMVQSAGASMIMSVLNQANDHSQRKMAVTQAEAITLYKIIKDLGREVSHDFHEYKKCVHQVARACTDYEDMQKMVAEARAGQDAATQIQMEFLLRKNRREIDELNEDARNSRDSLVTIAGADAVDNLDREIETESQKIGMPVVAHDEILKEESADSKVVDKSESVSGSALPTGERAVAAAPKRKHEPIDGAEQETGGAKSDTTPGDDSTDKPL